MKILYIFFALVIFTMITPQKTLAQGSTASFQIFYDDLSPYGAWISNPDYGFVWVPNVPKGFAPYATNGYWIYTDDGWAWVSNYSWGWAPFHYGRWFNDPTYGPVWVPDNEWGPGWVTWRSSDDYYGWAPMGPNVSVNVAYGATYIDNYNHYTFVNRSHFGGRHINKYYEKAVNNDGIIKRSNAINNTRFDKNRNATYHGGPDKIDVEKRSGRTITPIAIQERAKPGQLVNNKRFELFRPKIQKNAPDGKTPAPAKLGTTNKTVSPVKKNNVEIPMNKTNKAVKSKSAQMAPNDAVKKVGTEKKIKEPAKVKQNGAIKKAETEKKTKEPAKIKQNGESKKVEVEKKAKQETPVKQNAASRSAEKKIQIEKTPKNRDNKVIKPRKPSPQPKPSPIPKPHPEPIPIPDPNPNPKDKQTPNPNPRSEPNAPR